MLEIIRDHPIGDAIILFVIGVGVKTLQDRAADKVNEVIDPLLEKAIATIKTKDWWAVFDDLRATNPDLSYRDIVSTASLLLELPLLSRELWDIFIEEVKAVDNQP